MSVLVFNNTEEGRRQADAVVGPKHEWLDNVRIIVYTGEDYLPYAPAPTEVDAQTYVNQMPDDQLDWLLDMAFGQSPDSDTRRTLFRKFSPAQVCRSISMTPLWRQFNPRSSRP